jgi:hypothetical protein
VDAKGILYVANFGQCNVEEYLSGKDHPHQKITDEINGPTGLTVGKNGSLYVTNTGWQGCNGDTQQMSFLRFHPVRLRHRPRKSAKAFTLRGHRPTTHRCYHSATCPSTRRSRRRPVFA